MIAPRFLKNRPAFRHWLLNPWWLTSLAIHSLFLLLPVFHSQSEVLEQEVAVPFTQVNVSTIQRSPQPVAQVVLPAQTTAQAPDRSAIAPPTRSTVPPVTLAATATRPPSPSVPPASETAVRPVLPPSPVALSPSPQPSPSPAVSPTLSPVSASPSPQPSPSPAAIPTPVPSPQAQETPVEASPHESLLALVNAHPVLVDVQQGCGGRNDCWQTSNTQWREIAVSLVESLQTEGFETERLELENDTGVRVYRIIKDEQLQYYLTLISTFQGTRYLILPEQMTSDELNQLLSQ